MSAGCVGEQNKLYVAMEKAAKKWDRSVRGEKAVTSCS